VPGEKTVSIVIPQRNEAGSIETAVESTPAMAAWTEGDILMILDADLTMPEELPKFFESGGKRTL
jgi:hypothetical protein